MDECIFCKIIKGEIPSFKIYEDEDYYAFLDIRPLNLGHSLVIPKKHYRWVWDDPKIDAYYRVVGKVANAIRRVMKTDWVVSTVFGEEVPHAHVWLVPRFENDGHGGSIDLANIKNIEKEKMIEIANLLSNELRTNQ